MLAHSQYTRREYDAHRDRMLCEYERRVAQWRRRKFWREAFITALCVFAALIVLVM
jgi:hypothetical protein